MDGDSLFLYTARKGEEVLGTAVETFTNQGFSGEIKLMVGFDPEGSIIDIAVVKHAETPGLGDKMEKGQIGLQCAVHGKDPNTFNLAVKKDRAMWTPSLPPPSPPGLTAMRCKSAPTGLEPYNKRMQQQSKRRLIRTRYLHMNQWKNFSKGFIRENAVFALFLGLCPTLGVTTSAINGLAMGLATTFVLVMSNLVVSLIKSLIPDKVRIPCLHRDHRHLCDRGGTGDERLCSRPL
jgi:hypothetical protein